MPLKNDIGNQYVWTGPDNLNGAVVDMEIPGTYIVDILQDNTRQVKDTVVVEFNDCVGECKVIAPTASHLMRWSK